MDDNEPPVTPIDVTEYDSDGEEKISTLRIGLRQVQESTATQRTAHA